MSSKRLSSFPPRGPVQPGDPASVACSAQEAGSDAPSLPLAGKRDLERTEPPPLPAAPRPAARAEPRRLPLPLCGARARLPAQAASECRRLPGAPWPCSRARGFR